MNRRGFLGLMAASAVAFATVSKLGHLVPKLASVPKKEWVEVSFKTSDLELSIGEFRRKILEPAMKAMKHQVDNDMMKLAYGTS